MSSKTKPNVMERFWDLLPVGNLQLSLSSPVTTGEMYGENTTGRPRGKYLGGLSAWKNRDKNTDFVLDWGDRVRWRTMSV